MTLRFRHLGRAWHPVVDSPAALAHLLDLDEALWVATAAPIATLAGDRVFLASLDADGDGRIRADHVREAIRWTLGLLRDTAGMRSDNDTLRCEAVDPAHPQAAAILESIRVILERLGGTGDRVSLAQVRAIRAEEEARGLHAAGRVQPGAADGEVGALLAHVLSVTGGEPHPAGGAAVTEATLARFLDEAAAWLAWHDRGADVRRLGEATGQASELLESLGPKLEQYFLLCDALRLDPGLVEAAWIQASPSELLEPSQAAALLARAPLARPRPDGVLDLTTGINPVFHASVARLREEVVRPILGDDAALDRARWATLREALAPWRDWLAARPETNVGALAADVVRRHVGDAALAADVRALLRQTEHRARVFAGVTDVEKLVLFQRDLIAFCNSYASHVDLYAPDRLALYEMGTLVLDGRRLNLAVRVPDAARHEKFCNAASMYVLYAQIGEKGGAWEYEVAVPVTAGDRGNLREGIYGVFHDRDGHERHALVRKVISNPISLREAIWAPLADVVAGIEGLFDKARDTQRAMVATAVPAKLPDPAHPAAPAVPASQIVALIAGAGIALAAVSAAVAGIVSTFQTGVGALSTGMTNLLGDLGLVESTVAALSPLVLLLAIVLTILGFFAIPLLAYLIPVVISAWLKLRRRDLAVLLEAGGWAINQRMFLSRATARQFTHEPKVPRGARE